MIRKIFSKNKNFVVKIFVFFLFFLNNFIIWRNNIIYIMDDLKDIKFIYYECVICKKPKCEFEFLDFKCRQCEVCIRKIFDSWVVKRLKDESTDSLMQETD